MLKPQLPFVQPQIKPLSYSSLRAKAKVLVSTPVEFQICYKKAKRYQKVMEMIVLEAKLGHNFEQIRPDFKIPKHGFFQGWDKLGDT
jgi:hypothetical protein